MALTKVDGELTSPDFADQNVATTGTGTFADGKVNFSTSIPISLTNGTTETVQFRNDGSLKIGGTPGPAGGNVQINSDGTGQFDGILRLAAGAYIGTVTNTKRLDDSSNGSSSASLFIGNASIQVSSDVRLKENIEDTSLDALSAIQQIDVKDFTWNDPSDTSFNNRNARGKWTGLIAQELVEILPFVVNAPRKESDGLIDHDSEETWTLDQSQLCPVLIKAMQQQQEIITALEQRLTDAGL